MKRATILVVLAVSGVLAAGAVMPAISQPPQERVTITWFDPNKTDFEKNLNLGGKGFGAGDMALIKDSLFDPETCEKAGTALLRFQVIKRAGREDAFFLTDGGVLLPDGKLSISFPGRFSEFVTGASGAVTGGTEAYKDVRGDFSVTEDQRMCDRNGAVITADLLLQ